MITIRNILRLGNAFNKLSVFPNPCQLITKPSYSFAFMQLFERHKSKAQLDPVFKRETKMKGHLKSRSSKHHSNKLNTLSVRKPKQKLKNHKGLLKRIKIVGPRWNRQFKFQSPGKGHLRRNKSRANLMRKRLTRYVHKTNLFKVKKLIPYFKRKSLKLRY